VAAPPAATQHEARSRLCAARQRQKIRRPQRGSAARTAASAAGLVHMLRALRMEKSWRGDRSRDASEGVTCGTTREERQTFCGSRRVGADRSRPDAVERMTSAHSARRETTKSCIVRHSLEAIHTTRC